MPAFPPGISRNTHQVTSTPSGPAPRARNIQWPALWRKPTRNLELADALAQRALLIIAHFQPKAWWMENPWMGLLRTRPVVAGLPYIKIDDCRIGSPDKKRTALWTNVPFAETLFDKTCPSWDGACHTAVAQRGGNRRGAPRQTLDMLHALPERLTAALEAATRAFIASEGR